MNEHGDYAVLLTDNIIESTLASSVNERGALAYINNVEDKVAELHGKAFVMLIDNLELEGATPKAYALLEQYTRWLNQQAMIAKACLVSSMAQKEIMLQRAPALKQQNVHFFNDRATALAWLHHQCQLNENSPNRLASSGDKTAPDGHSKVK